MIVSYQPIDWKGDMVKLLDQTPFPDGRSLPMEITDFLRNYDRHQGAKNSPRRPGDRGSGRVRMVLGCYGNHGEK